MHFPIGILHFPIGFFHLTIGFFHLTIGFLKPARHILKHFPNFFFADGHIKDLQGMNYENSIALFCDLKDFWPVEMEPECLDSIPKAETVCGIPERLLAAPRNERSDG
ncbi:MAG: hypothetical protein ACREDU_09560 [Methylocella sp.]